MLKNLTLCLEICGKERRWSNSVSWCATDSVL